MLQPGGLWPSLYSMLGKRPSIYLEEPRGEKMNNVCIVHCAMEWNVSTHLRVFDINTDSVHIKG